MQMILVAGARVPDFSSFREAQKKNRLYYVQIKGPMEGSGGRGDR